MDIKKLQRAIVDGLEDVKGQNIVVFDTEHLSSLFERVIIASGTSNRQTRSLAASVRDAVKASGFAVPRVEGEENGEWIIVDCGAAVVHLMQPLIREYYHLEEIWGDKPVKLKKEAASGKLVKAEEPAAPPAAKRTRATAGSKATSTGEKKTADSSAPAKKVTAKKAVAKKAVAPKAPAKKAVSAQAKPVVKKTAQKTTTTSSPSTRKITRTAGVKAEGAAPVKTAAIKKAAVKASPKTPEKTSTKPAAKKVVAKKAVASSAGKAAGKVPAKKTSRAA